jgi:nanoRNase/pAp phosphatase (c-di-AMP/oligoRNAs hydrolase)
MPAVVDPRRGTAAGRRSDGGRTNPDRPTRHSLVRDALADLPPEIPRDRSTTAFVETCLEAVADSAAAAARRNRGRPQARRLLRVLAGAKSILVTTHLHPDPDALASSLAMVHLLRAKLPAATVSLSVKGRAGGGINNAFAQLSDLGLVPWDDEKLAGYDAIVLLDVQPQSAYSPLPKTVPPTAVIDHHRTSTKLTKCTFCDIRTGVGATSSILFSYLMELEVAITPTLAASLLFAIESDLAGAAGEPGELDNLALSSLTLVADTHKLYQMRYVDLPAAYFVSYAAALNNAMFHPGGEGAIVSHLGTIDSLEKPAVMADFLLRLDAVRWSMVTAIHEDRLVMSLRTRSKTLSAVDVIRKITRELGTGGGHRLKAGGFVELAGRPPAEVHDTLSHRLLRALHIRGGKGQPLVPANGLPVAP